MRVLVAVDDSGFAEDLLRAVLAGIRHEIRRFWSYTCFNRLNCAPA